MIFFLIQMIASKFGILPNTSTQSNMESVTPSLPVIETPVIQN